MFAFCITISYTFLSEGGKNMDIRWKKDYGDGEYTEDLVLWLDGHPTNSYICDRGGFKSVFVGDEEIAMVDTFKEGKEFIMWAIGLSFLNRSGL